jgi:hypothetical protein
MTMFKDTLVSSYFLKIHMELDPQRAKLKRNLTESSNNYSLKL